MSDSAYFLATPLWSVKTRQQTEIGLDPSRQRSGTVTLLISDFKERGFTGMWRGAGPLVIRGGLISAGQIGGCAYIFTLPLVKILTSKIFR